MEIHFHLQMFLLKNKFLLLIVFFCFTFLNVSNAQNVVVDENFLLYKDPALVMDKATSENPELLVEYLIKDKHTDQEKLDIIFKWVTLKINYSTSGFYEPIDYSPKNISDILKKRSTVCLGFSNLMDSLCKLAGLKSATILGYGKTEDFDIGDSLYLHNHAWNAVKLDGYWYLYDVTWSLKQRDFMLTKWGKRVKKFLFKHPQSFKRKKRVSKPIDSRCNPKSKKEVSYYYKEKKLRRFFRKLIVRIPIKKRKSYYKGANTYYYLSEPNVFAATHIADDPIWNFSDKKSIRELETDSVIYYLNDSILKKQNRIGTLCQACDDYYNLSQKNKLQSLNANSQLFNSKNKFISVVTEEGLSKLYSKEAINSEDTSFIRMTLDTSLFYIEKGIGSLNSSKKNFGTFIYLQKKKNQKKKYLLLNENANHLKLVNTYQNKFMRYSRVMREIQNKTKVFVISYVNKLNAIQEYNPDLNPSKRNKSTDAKIEKTKLAFSKLQDSIVKLNEFIVQKIELFDTLIAKASLNLWQQRYHINLLTDHFEYRTNLRRDFLDNYKKKVVDVTRKIYDEEKKYDKDLTETLFNPTDTVAHYFSEIIESLKIKSKLQYESLKQLTSLIKYEAMQKQSLEEYKNEVEVQNANNYCWLNNKIPIYIVVSSGYDFLFEYQKNYINIIREENAAERTRASLIGKDINAGYRESNKSISKWGRRLKMKRKAIRTAIKRNKKGQSIKK